uniref:Uncharacterized protein n=1 Tax=Parascaris equorum TaxID=6256 RepID=A0A914S715_PAREQ
MNQWWGRDSRRTIENPVDGPRVSHTISYNVTIKTAKMSKTVLREGGRICSGSRQSRRFEQFGVVSLLQAVR